MDLVSQGETCNVLKKKIFQINLNDIDNNSFISLLNEIDDSKVINLFTKLEERFLLDIFSKLFEVFRSKDKRNYIISYNVGLDIISKTNEWSCVSYVNVIKESLKRNESKNEREYSYKLLINLIENYNDQMSICMSELIPIVTNDTNSPIKEVKEKSLKCLKLLLNCSGNDDLKPFIPIVLKAIVDKSKIPEAVEQLAGCIFVQNVEDSALSVTIPILIKGLVDRQTETKRKCCVIINNMCELVEHPKEVISFSVRIQSLLESCSENISDPEARNVANKALNTLKSSLGSFSKDILLKKTKEDVFKLFEINEGDNKNIMYLCELLANLCNKSNFNKDLWKNIYDSYCPTQYFNELIFNKIFDNLKCSFEIKEDIYEDNEEGENLYQGSFSLAYGALTLLNNANLHLKRNRFYGLLGPNNCGKTTLMRAISNEQVEGFPKRDQLKTVFVEHEIQEREVGEDEKGFPILNIDLSGVEWVVDCCNNVYNLENKVTSDEVEKVMETIGFGNSKKDKGHDRAADAWMGVTTYSGGWKMKMQLCAATLMNADILMLDEPTGHLDVTNIAWIKSWLNDFINNGGSIITTSHDSSFLNEMCTHLIDFQNRKLKTFKGNYGSVLQEFVEKYPEKKGYFELKNDVMKFTFPDPSQLEGVKSLSKSILKMKDITFTYPTRDKPTITNVSLECSRVSRVAVIGANGAGKSTAIKILIGELKPEVGEIWKHPNVRLAYIAQHAFHHLEKHIHKTPTQYILWRFAGNEDKENVDLINNRVEESEIKKKYMIDPSTMTELRECFGDDEEKKAVEVEKILKRRDNKKEKTKEYEVKLKGKSEDLSLWVQREILINMGCLSLVQRHDEKEAVAAGLMSKPLTSASIEKHLFGFGIESEHASHTLIKSLSGGQKVKVVLAASLWQNPHLVILDEPTNYLDRDGLGALTKAIEEFKGGVIIISHNREFANAVSQEKWIMEKGNLRKEGESYGTGKEEESQNSEIKGDEIVKDSFGNEIKVDKKQNLSDKDKKKEIKNLQKKIKDGRKKGTLTEDQILDLEDKIEELKK
jgi:elongation factor 3